MEIEAAAAARRLAEARTWPSNTTTMRTLAFSVPIPAITVLGQRLVEVYIQ